MNPQQKTDTLFGGRRVTVTYQPTDAEIEMDGFQPRVESLRVRQIPIRDYENAFKLFDDEIALTAFLCGREKPWAETLLPHSYEEVLRVGQEVNVQGFFVYCVRRRETEKTRQNEMLAAMNAMPPDMLKMAFEIGNKTQTISTSPMPSPNPFARRA